MDDVWSPAGAQCPSATGVPVLQPVVLPIIPVMPTIGEHAMTCSRRMTLSLAASLTIANVAAFEHDESKYPDCSGQWRRPPGVGVQWDPSKPLGPAQRAPLTPEFQKVFEASLADQKAGGQGGDPTYTCIATGLPLHPDNKAVVKERIYLDKDNRDLLRDEITTIDNALAQPWTVMKTYQRDSKAKTIWFEYVCAEGNHHVVLGKENYFVSDDGYLMPARKGQAKPDLKYFDQPAR